MREKVDGGRRSSDNVFPKRQNDRFGKSILTKYFSHSKNEIKTNIIKEIQEKIDGLKLPRRHVVYPALIHLGDVSDAVRDSNFLSDGGHQFFL